MLIIRRAEQMIQDDFKENKIFSFYHSSVGQEAVAVGVCMALDANDRVYGNHRSHGHYIAKGGDLYRMFCEIYGKADGCCRGYGGSMHMIDKSVNFMGSTPILGSVVPIAAGSAFEQKYTGLNGITVAFFGDGASEEGVVYETINLAAVQKLPIVFVIEDNLYAVNSTESVRRSPRFSRRSVYEGLGVRFLECDGNDFESVYWQATMAAKVARTKGPVVLHAVTHRWMAHSGPILDESVRGTDTAVNRMEENCIQRVRLKLKEKYVADALAAAEAEVTTAWSQAKLCEVPNPWKETLNPYV